jgi:chromatin assembly factor 1 subunit B
MTSPSAVDCWPTPLNDDPQPSNSAEKSALTSYSSLKMDAENTEDIRLVYDEDADMEECSKTPGNEVLNANKIEEIGSPAAKPTPAVTPKEKTPRRVEFRTISTPKSKKKLL